MKVRLNLSTSPLENHRRFLLGAGVVGTAALLLLAVLSVYTFKVWRANRDFRGEVSRLEREMSSLRAERTELEKFFKQRDTQQVMDRAALLNGLIQERSFPWTRLFMDLEGLLPAGVRVVSIAPKMKDGGGVEIVMVIGAQSDDLKERVLRAFEEAKQFQNIQLLGEKLQNRPGDRDRLEMELVATYVAEGR